MLFCSVSVVEFDRVNVSWERILDCQNIENHSEAYLEHYHTYQMKLFVKIFNGRFGKKYHHRCLPTSCYLLLKAAIVQIHFKDNFFVHKVLIYWLLDLQLVRIKRHIVKRL